MASEKQNAANRKNAGKSTGPQTEPGKARSSRNAVKHGLTSEQIVMFDEDPSAFDDLRDGLYALYQPSDPYAEHLVERVAANMWRLKRAPEIYAAIFEDGYLSEQASRAGTRSVIRLRGIEEGKVEDQRDDPRPVLGRTFSNVERSLNSLLRIEAAIESSMYRAIHNLELIKAERDQALIEDAVIEEPRVCPLPRKRKRPRALN